VIELANMQGVDMSGAISSGKCFPEQLCFGKRAKNRIPERNNMRKVNKKKVSPLTVVHGIKPETALPMVSHIDSCVALDIGWVQLHFGWNEKWSEVVYAVAGNRTFLLCERVPLHAVAYAPDDSQAWVYAIDSLPTDFNGSLERPTCTNYNGFHIEHGSDSEGRPYVWLCLPNRAMQLLLRNPSTKSSEAWSPRPAFRLGDGVTIEQWSNARYLSSAADFSSTGDEELDNLLNQMGE